MKIGKSSNPALNLDKWRSMAFSQSDSQTMTIQGVANKTIILLLLAMATATMVWRSAFSGGEVMGWVIGGGIFAFIVALVISFKPQWAPIGAPVYALAEGLVLGGISAMFASMYQGIVIKAVLLTFGVLMTMLFVYKSGMIKVTEKFKMGLTIAMGGIFVMYLLTWILGMFGVNMGFMHDGGPLSILLSLGIVIVASLVLIWDFSTIEEGVAMGAPKFMEWYSAFSLMVTLVWLYLEILRLVSYFSSND